MKKFFATLSLLLILTVAPTWVIAEQWAELAPPNKKGVTMGQLHYIVRDIEANKQFWLALGALPAKEEGGQVFLKIPGVVISLTKGTPSGTSIGSVMDHVGFQVPDVQQLKVRMEARGYKTEPAPSGSKLVGYVFTPEGEKLEFLEDGSTNVVITFDDGTKVNGKAQGPRMTVPILLHHVHPFVPKNAVEEMKAWYIKNFGGVSSRRWEYVAVDLPGVNFNISGVPAELPPTRGRIQDYIGFEIRDLEAFCKKLDANGVKFDKPYTKEPSGLATAYLTDPWGLSIQLTEGLGHY